MKKYKNDKKFVSFLAIKGINWLSTGSVPAAVKDEETIQQAHGDWKMENFKFVFQLQADIKREVLLGEHFFY